MPLQLNTLAGGSVTINAASTPGTYTLNVPAVNGTLITSADVNSITGGMIASNTITSSSLNLNVIPLGVGQTWQNVYASRSAGVTYTNTTGRPIFVAVYGSTSPSNGQSMGLSVDGITVSYCFFAYASNQFSATVNGVVPPGSTYSVSVGSTSIATWSELR
jgi:hypothetical protein